MFLIEGNAELSQVAAAHTGSPMPTYRSPEEVQAEYIAAMGDEFGRIYYALVAEFLSLRLRWQQYRELFGTTPERVELLQQAASLCFGIMQDALWENTLLHLSRLTDRPTIAGKDTLSIRRLPALVADQAFRTELAGLIDVAVTKIAFARDWRNRTIAHTELRLALNLPSPVLSEASRASVEGALHSLGKLLSHISEHFFDSEMDFGPTGEPGDALELLHVVRDGLAAARQRDQRISEGRLLPEDLEPYPTL